jgi:hypothetical protein
VVVLRRRLSVLVAMVVLTLMLVATRDVSAEPPQPVDVTAPTRPVKLSTAMRRRVKESVCRLNASFRESSYSTLQDLA